MVPINKILAKYNTVISSLESLLKIKDDLERVKQALGRIESRQLQVIANHNINANEFQVFSQGGEDGIIQFLINNVRINRKIFIEFGVDDYTECNTRFLLKNHNWSGLVMDGNINAVQSIKSSSIYWQNNLKAVHAFINKDNINELIKDNGITGEIGLLSVDIDGNDYWVWQAINVVSPAIVVSEYNYRFGKDKALTTPYDESFVRSKAHYSMIYYGASLKALVQLGNQKGYAFVGCNSAGNNAFFVRRDLKPECIQELSVEEGFVAGQFRESRDQNAKLLYLSPTEEDKIISSLPLVEVS